ncbi:hypothetical protein BU24DRAFT_187829 [Aaosphaeria arxii CBS 175.79]|uniref:Uncharacterized protein n=1 Tax=Aaosphaeria arxii CBS 175.79 TaxID=1450172 RepID=A0A6A5XSP0_9PLEO|nr:uncharacterized protein BU24DRAFT_187829 [Aaosphaeria arxii CBS 175.79]KAF2015919.1 hypothetical protein BU24DRAFT_187829 [Aaosphaeria arxii CBS 175.79]
MCLFSVRREEDVVVPVRVARRRSPSPIRERRSSHQRVSRTSVIRESRPQSSSYIVPAPQPQGLRVPDPQPVPVFVQEPQHIPIVAPPPPPSHISSHHSHHHHGGAHYVEVSPHSSVTSHSPDRSEYITREREYTRERRRDYSPESSPRYEHFRYVEGPPVEEDRYERFQRRERSVSRRRSPSREYVHDPRGSYRETNTRITISDGDGRRTREYRR